MACRSLGLGNLLALITIYHQSGYKLQALDPIPLCKRQVQSTPSTITWTLALILKQLAGLQWSLRPATGGRHKPSLYTDPTTLNY